MKIGGGSLAMIAGPCAVESYEVLDTIAGYVKAGGANILRGGAFKPRTSPYAFQGMGEDGLKILRDVGQKHDMPVVTEVMDPRQVELVVQLRRHVPDRRPQHAELRPAEGVRQDARRRCCSSAA